MAETTPRTSLRFSRPESTSVSASVTWDLPVATVCRSLMDALMSPSAFSAILSTASSSMVMPSEAHILLMD